MRTIRIVSVAFCLTVGAFLLFGQGHDNDHENKNDRNRNGDPNEDAQSERYGTEAAEGAFFLVRLVGGRLIGRLARVVGELLRTAAVQLQHV